MISRIRQRQSQPQSQSHTQPQQQFSSTDNAAAKVDMNVNMREDYIDAVFGPSFLPLATAATTPTATTKSGSTKTPNNHNEPATETETETKTRQGTGLAQIPYYVSYQASIPPPKKAAFSEMNLPLEAEMEPKLGLTLTKLALGLYVRSVQAESEAELAGILPNSILVSINGMGMLVEPSTRALERLWQYEGVFVAATHGTHGTNGTNGTNDSHSFQSRKEETNQQYPQPQPHPHQQTQTNMIPTPMHDVVAMTFIRHGKLYTATLLAKHPHRSSWGIQWASCADFCLVNRAYSYAQSIGLVKRGSILASVNGQTFRHFKYDQLAQRVQQIFQQRLEPLNLELCFTPAAGRTGYFERLYYQHDRDQPNFNKSKNSNANTAAAAAAAAKRTTGTNAATATATATATHQYQHQHRTTSYNQPPPSKQYKTKRTVHVPTRTQDGVEIRIHSFGDSWKQWREAAARRNTCLRQHRCGKSSTSCNNTTPSSASSSLLTTTTSTSVMELARRVVEAEVDGPISSRDLTFQPHWNDRHQHIYLPCPTLPKTEFLRIWDPLQALMYCLSSYDYQHSTTKNNGTTGDRDMAPGSLHLLYDSAEAAAEILEELATDHLVQVFLWQFISVIGHYTRCYGDTTANFLPTTTKAATMAATNATTTFGFWEEKKDDENALPLTSKGPSASTTATALKWLPSTASNGNNSIAQVLSSVLLKLSRKDQDFCQRLYFALRSMDLDESQSFHEMDPQPLQQQSSNPHHLLALYNCLKLLRSAEQEVTNTRLSMLSIEQQYYSHRSSGAPKGAHNAKEDTIVDSGTMKPTTETDLPSTADTSQLQSQLPGTNSQKIDKRRLFGFFKKSKQRKKNNIKHAFVPPEKAPKPPTNKQSSVKHLSPRRILSHSLSQSHQYQQNEQKTALQPSPPPILQPENITEFIKELDSITKSIEKRLLKSFSQKIADWALQPWSASKSSALHSLTAGMRQSLRTHSGGGGGVLIDASKIESQPEKKKYHSSLSTANTARTASCPNFCLVNPLDPHELLVGIDPEGCYILPSAHFPILLSFDATERHGLQHKINISHSSSIANTTKIADSVLSHRGPERLYRITVEVCNLPSSAAQLVLHGAIAGAIQESASCTQPGKPSHVFRRKMSFRTRSTWGAPRTLALRLSSVPKEETNRSRMIGVPLTADGLGWVDLGPLWDRLERFQEPESFQTAKIYPIAENGFDEQGMLVTTMNRPGERMRPLGLECKVTLEVNETENANSKSSFATHKRLLLYKHDDDLRLEAFSIQFIRTCDILLKASGLDLKLLTFDCIPVGPNRGFIEWVEGSVPLSDICQKPFSFLFGTSGTKTSAAATSIASMDRSVGKDDERHEDDMSMLAKAGLTNYGSLSRMSITENANDVVLTGESQPNQQQQQQQQPLKPGPRGSLTNNPIQDFLRSIAYDPAAPYFCCQQVMDNFVKSCAGYCVITYVLGVGDRHLDNLLLHNQTGCFFHCDYSFLFGNDPKKYLPMRVTEGMILGFGGRDSDNWHKFLSLTGSAFLTLRRPENVRMLLSLVRTMEGVCLSDAGNVLRVGVGSAAANGRPVSSRGPEMNSGSTSNMTEIVLGMRERLRLDLTQEEAVAFMEDMIEASLSSKMWMAVDAIHSLGKRF